MIALYVFAFVSLIIWAYLRVSYFIVHRPLESFWLFLRRSLTPGASAFIKLVDIAVKLYAAYLFIQILAFIWRQF